MIIPVPKGKNSPVLNDYRPIALTSNIMKCLERLVLKFLVDQAGSYLDRFQFACRGNREVDDAILVYLHKLYSHLDIPKSYARSLFVDFWSAFNTIQPHILVNKRLQMNVSPKIVQWIHFLFNFLRTRLQWVKIGNVNSDVRINKHRGAAGVRYITSSLFFLYK